MSDVVVITGANRGIGLALARDLVAAGHTVVGTARRPDAAGALRATGATVVELEVDDPASVETFAAAVGRLTDRVDVLVNNAAVKTVPGRAWEDSAGPLGGLDAEAVLAVYRTNLVGPLIVTQSLLPLLRNGRGVVASISSNLSSYALSRGVDYAYNSSKTALNMLTVVMARDLGPSGIVPVAVTPGWVRTDMGGSEAPLDLDDVSAALAALVPRLGPEHTGLFVDRFGVTQPW